MAKWHYLLLGAGFSRNWGGWLADEVFEYLLGRPEIVASEELRRILWESQLRGGFEYALEVLQAAAGRGDSGASDHVEKLKAAVVAMFDEMNYAFDDIVNWELSDQHDSQISTFLMKFDAIFSLNQDLLLERHYLSGNPELRHPERWIGAAMPGIAPIAAPTASIIGQRWQILADDEFKIDARIQPYFKLHGSTNWNSRDGKGTLVIGGNKTEAIGGSPILTWYFREFEAALFAGDARLMVIGYGFRDQHINDLIIRAVNHCGLKLFVVSPEGAGQARLVNRSAGGAIHASDKLESAFERGVIGASRRGLKEIFGGRGAELAKLERYFS